MIEKWEEQDGRPAGSRTRRYVWVLCTDQTENIGTMTFTMSMARFKSYQLFCKISCACACVCVCLRACVRAGVLAFVRVCVKNSEVFCRNMKYLHVISRLQGVPTVLLNHMKYLLMWSCIYMDDFYSEASATQPVNGELWLDVLRFLEVESTRVTGSETICQSGPQWQNPS